jgi:hypothetical protein
LHPDEAISSKVIIVGASDMNDRRHERSNWGSRVVSLFAPGVNILSTYPEWLCDRDCIYPNIPDTHFARGYHWVGQTSHAAPHVSAVISLIMSYDINTSSGGLHTLSPAEIKQIILESVDVTPALVYCPILGQQLTLTGGRLNAAKALGAVQTRRITFRKNDGSSATKGQRVRTNVQSFLRSNIFERPNYGFAGWATTPNGSVQYINVANYPMENSDVDLYAVWIASYNIGDVGPGGGMVFYDKGFYSDGWRYIEVLLDDFGATCWIEAMKYSGLPDWKIPNPYELEQMYLNLHLNGLGGFQDALYLSIDCYCVSSGSSGMENWLLDLYTGLSFELPANKESGSKAMSTWAQDFHSGSLFEIAPYEEAYARLIRRF